MQVALPHLFWGGMVFFAEWRNACMVRKSKVAGAHSDYVPVLDERFFQHSFSSEDNRHRGGQAARVNLE